MSYFINPVEEDQCVFLTYEDQMSMELADISRREVNKLLAAKRWNRVLVDMTGWRSAPSTADIFKFAQSLSSANSPVRARIALVIRPEQTPYARLLEKILRTKRVFLTYFVDLDKAEAWIKQTNFIEQRGSCPARNGISSPETQVSNSREISAMRNCTPQSN